MKVLLTGGEGMLGSNIFEAWRAARPTSEIVCPTRADLDLRDSRAVRERFLDIAPDIVIHCAAAVGGIAKKIAEPATYLLSNLQIDSSVFDASIAADVRNMIYISSAAIYPEKVEQPIVEDMLLSGPLEPANESYALAKLSGARMCAFISKQYGYHYRAVAPANLYGPGDDYTPGRSHLVASTLAKIDSAKREGANTVSIWGDGHARREFVFVPDLARWLVEQSDKLDRWPDLLNLGNGVDYTIREYYEAAAATVGYRGSFDYDLSKPTGVRQRLVDSSRANRLGWKPTTSLADGMAETYMAFLERS